MKSIILILLFTFFSVNSSADQAEINTVLAGINGIWQDSKGNYSSIQSDDKGYLLFLILEHSITTRASELIKLGIEVKPEYLAYYGRVDQENIFFSTNPDNSFNGDYSFTIEPLVLLRQVYPDYASSFTDSPLKFMFSMQFSTLSVDDAGPTGGGIHVLHLKDMKKVF